MAPDGPRECRLAVVINIQDAALGTQRAQLLLVVGNPWRQRRQVPVQVSVALLAAQAQRVHPLGRHGCGQRPGHPVHDPLEAQELRLVGSQTQLST